MTLKKVANVLKSRMGRVTSSGSFIANIDGLRFFAVISVVFFHIEQKIRQGGVVPDTSFGEVVQRLFQTGWFGVELFFAISGFVLALPFARHHLSGKSAPPGLGKYYLRRLTRIEPPYVISLLFFFLLRIFFNGQDGRQLFPHLAASLFYVHNAWFNSPSLINAVSWSLEVEVQFYLLAPLLAQVFRLKSPVVRCGAFLTLPILVNLPFLGMDVWSVYRIANKTGANLFGFLQYFMVGFIVADLYVSRWKENPGRSRAWDAAGILSAGLIVMALFQRWSAMGMVVSLLVMVCMVSAFRGVWCRQIACAPWLATIGGMCYTIYLYHNILSDLAMTALLRLLPDQSFLICLLLGLLVVVPLLLAISASLFVTCEKPFMYRDWPQKTLAAISKAFHFRRTK